MGNSITDGWDDAHPEFFTDNNFACRGIGGQVSSQMLCRFRADVINLRPKAVVILAGTNDLALNNGSDRHRTHRRKHRLDGRAGPRRRNPPDPLLGTPRRGVSLAPRSDGRPRKDPGPQRPGPEVCRRTRDRMGGLPSGTGRRRRSLRPEYTYDGVHPTRAGYDVMEKVIMPVLAPYRSETR